MPLTIYDITVETYNGYARLIKKLGYYYMLCHVGRCLNKADYKCPSCHGPVCEQHAQAHVCSMCYAASAIEDDIREVEFD